MSKLMSGALILVLLLSCLLVTATSCGSSDKTSATTKSGNSTTTTPSTQTTTSGSSSGSLSWSDMPIYGGASEIQKGNWSIPASNESDYAKMEWRYYEVNASITEISSYYKQQMPTKGWTEQSWMATPEMNWGMFNKNTEKDAAMVWVSTGDKGKTTIALWRAAK